MNRCRWLVVALAMAVIAGCAGAPRPHAQPTPAPGAPIQSDAGKTDRLDGQMRMRQAEQGTPDLQDGPENVNREPQPLTLVDLRKKYASNFLLSGPTDQRKMALTFDDAPDDVFTPQVLDMLKREGVKATFFVVGNRIEAHPDIMRRIVQEGHLIGNHSYNHANLPKLSDPEFREQIQKTDRLIRQYAGYVPTYVRPPYGNISEEQIKWLVSQKKKIVNWNIDSLDWKNLNAEQVAVNVLSHAQPGAIVLQHSGGGLGEDLTGTVQALPKIIGKLKNDGVELVRLDELLGFPAGVEGS